MKPIFRSSTLKSGILLILAIILALGVSLPGLDTSAQSTQPTPGTTGVQGQVESKASDNSSFTIQNNLGKTTTVKVNQNTTYLQIIVSETAISGILNLLETIFGSGTDFSLNTIMGMPGAGALGMFGGMGLFIQMATFNDITVGDTVAVQTTPPDLAASVAIFKFPNVNRVHGTVTAVKTDSLTITPASGSEVTLNWDTNTSFILKGQAAITSGQTATAMYRNNSTTAVFIMISTPASTGPAPTSTP